ncbi:hypothetical protein Dimus_039640 [Dionaea muscipula]
MDLSAIINKVREKGGGHVDKVFGAVYSPFSGEEAVKKEPKRKVARAKKGGKPKKGATSKVANVSEETHTEETAGRSLGSEATEPPITSGGDKETEVGSEATLSDKGEEEETEVGDADKGLQTKKRRHLVKESTKSFKKAKTDNGPTSNLELQDDPVVGRTPTTEDLAVDKLLSDPFLSEALHLERLEGGQSEDELIDRLGYQGDAQGDVQGKGSSDEEEGGMDDEGIFSPTCLEDISKARLKLPTEKMVQQYANVLLSTSSSPLKKKLDLLPREHAIALLTRNFAETSALLGHSLKREAMASTSRKENRRLMMELEEKN